MASRVGGILTRVPARLTLDGTAKEALETARNRIVVAGALFALAFGIIGLRLFDVTILKEAQEPRAPRVAETARLEMDRADIVDRNGVLLATSLASASLYANPKLVIDPADTAAKLARTLPGVSERLGRKLLEPEQGSELRRVGQCGSELRAGCSDTDRHVERVGDELVRHHRCGVVGQRHRPVGPVTGTGPRAGPRRGRF